MLRRQRILIVGGSFAGLTAAQRLSTRHAVTLIDRSPWFEWLPNIHELVSGVKQPALLRLPLQRAVERCGHEFLHAEVRRIDRRGRFAVIDGEERLGFDVCIVATGGMSNTFGIPGAARHAKGFKSVDQCVAIGARLADLAGREKRFSVVIVGGGLEGVEALGEILRRYRRHAGLSAHVVEREPRLLPAGGERLDRSVREHCRDLDVSFHTGRRVARVTARQVVLDDGERLPSDITIWTAGAQGGPTLLRSGLSERRGGWAPVRTTLQSRMDDRIFVAGDAAALPEPISKQAFFAIQMGEHVAGNADRLLRHRQLRDFSPADRPMLATFGDLDTYMVIGDRVIAGTALAALKEAIFQYTMALFDPPVEPRALEGIGGRLLRSGRKLLWPTLTSAEALLRLPQVRLL